MAKNFDKSKSAQKFNEVAKASNEKAVVVPLKNIENVNIFDYPHNSENITDTADLEKSIQELGFIDPIEVTTYGMDEGNFMIVSGHRRREAGVKCGINTFPCLVRTFNNDEEVTNYVLLANSQRDSSKDPLLIATRYRKHKDYLQKKGFTGAFREEIGKRLGLSPQQADRYNQFLDIIPEVWAMVKSEVVGMSSVLMMSTHSEAEQKEIVEMLLACQNEGYRLTRDRCENIIKAYRNGIKNFSEINAENKEKSSNTEILQTNKENIIESRESNEDEDNGNEDNGNEDNGDEDNGDEDNGDEDNGDEDNGDGEQASKKGTTTISKKPLLSENEQKKQRGLNINKNLEALEACFNEIYTFENKESAALTMKTIQGMMKLMLEELQNISESYDNEALFKSFVNDLKTNLQSFVE